MEAKSALQALSDNRYARAVWNTLPGCTQDRLRHLLGRSPALTTVASGVRSIELEQLDAELQRTAELFGRSEDEARAHLASFQLAPPGDAPPDPFSEEYRAWTWRLYERISGRGRYSLDNEASPFDLQVALRRPFPYQTGSPSVVGLDLQSRGLVLRALGSAAVNAQPPARVVEFGPGWGNLTADLRATGYEVIAVEVDSQFCELLECRLKTELPGVPAATISQQDMASFAPEHPVDVALYFESFHHCSNHLAMLERLHSMLKPEGRLVLAGEPVQPMVYPWGPRLDGLSLWSMRTYGWLELGFDRAYFLEVLDRTGWQLVPHEVGALPGGTELFVARPKADVLSVGHSAEQGPR